MGLFKETDQERWERERKERKQVEDAAKMTHEQLVLAMLLELDAGFNQMFSDHPLGKEAIKRCGYDPYQ